MKIVHLSKFYKPYFGGIESVVADLAESQSLEHEVAVVACGGNRHAAEEEIDGVTVYRCKSLANIFSTPISIGYISKSTFCSRFDVVHVHLPNPLANIAVAVSHLLGKRGGRLIVHWHSDIVKQKRLLRVYMPLLNWLLNKADAIIVTSPPYLDGSDQLAKYRQKCTVVPIGAGDLLTRVEPNIVESIRHRYAGKNIVFSLGRHIYYKGFEYLIEAAKFMEDTVVLIAGEGPDTGSYRRLINSHGVDDKVFLVGRIPDEQLPSYFAAAGVYCMPSVEKSEAFGVAQVEAMSVGVPVVSTDISGSGVPWVNLDGTSGLVCAVRDPQAIASAINGILSNHELRRRLSLGARARFEKSFRKDISAEKVMELYHSVIGSSEPAQRKTTFKL